MDYSSQSVSRVLKLPKNQGACSLGLTLLVGLKECICMLLVRMDTQPVSKMCSNFFIF